MPSEKGKQVLPLLERARLEYHQALCRDVLGIRGDSPTNADASSSSSKTIANSLAKKVATQARVQLEPISASPQELGRLFTEHTADFLKQTFEQLGHVRPGPWVFSMSQAAPGIARYEPYTHLAQLQSLVHDLRRTNPDVATFFSRDYLITPDIVIAREPWPDEKLNEYGRLPIILRDELAAYASLRKRHSDQPLILHASVSCKWTIRSDRVQNSRAEALNLLRHRKGRAPHIVVVVAEPMPTRIASIALGTGDIDCVYHFALPELEEALEEVGNEDQRDMLQQLVRGGRLRDISDLPLDLAV